jgi:uncharacterized protein (DUF1684 family)
MASASNPVHTFTFRMRKPSSDDIALQHTAATRAGTLRPAGRAVDNARMSTTGQGLIVLLALGPAALAACAPGATPYDHAAVTAFRAERGAILLADDGWFTVSGLHFLREGENSVGSASDNDIVLDYPEVPARVGVVTMTGPAVSIMAADGATLLLNNRPASGGPLRLADGERPADVVTYGNVTFFLHYSGPRLALRVRDQNAPLRAEFSGLNWFPVDPGARAVGTFTPAAGARVVQAPNILGDLEPFEVAGTVTFTLGGLEHAMEAWRSGGGFWFVFRDQTSADLTYPAARFLYTDPPNLEGQVVMDFNYARNPPCAYNPWTTCPLPPEPNRLAVRIEAGELRYHAEP